MIDAARLILVRERELTIENYTRDLEYDENIIRIKTVEERLK